MQHQDFNVTPNDSKSIVAAPLSGPLGSVSVSGSSISSDDEDLQITEPSKKRKRPQKISCELCKARKVKCDRAEPSCGWCARNHRVCIYKERKKPNLRASYGVELEDKLNRIENNLSVLGQRLDNHISAHSTFGRDSHRQTDNSASLFDTLSQPKWLSESSPQTNRASVPRDVNDRAVLSHASVDTPFQVSPAPGSETFRTRSAQYGDELPPFDLLISIVDLYFKHVGTWSPILERKATFDSLLGHSKPLQADDQVLLHGIIVVALRFCKDPRLTDDLRQSYYNTSRHKVQLYALEVSSVAAMKALALIAVDALGTSFGPHGWNLLALLVRNIVQLGLDVEKSVYLTVAATDSPASSRFSAISLPQPNSWIEDEGRRRLYWLTYVLDRYTTVATSFDFILNERDSDRSLPCRYDLFSKDEAVETRWLRVGSSSDLSKDSPENLGSFSYHCEVLQILSQIHDFLRQPLNAESAAEVSRWRDTYHDLDGKLNSWLSHLPGEYGKISQLCHSDPGSRVSNWIMIHAAFVTSVIRLHSVAAYPAARSQFMASSPTAVQRCLAAVDSIRAIAQDVIDTEMLDLLGPPFAFSLWASGRLLLVHAALMEAKVDDRIWFLISTLESMGHYWEVARAWANTLAHLAHEGQQADEEARQGRTTSKKTYTEMRRCAHDIAMLAGRQPRTVIDPPATRSTTDIELEYLDVFEWFNYPLNPSRSSKYHRTGGSVAVNSHIGDGGSLSGIDANWATDGQPYGFKPPYE